MPKASSKSLFFLIKSLSAEETQQFKKKVKNEEHLYIELFDLMAEMEEKAYDEKIILKKIPEIKPSQLSNLKNYLYHSILEALAETFSGLSALSSNKLVLDKISILFRKQLFDQSLKLIELEYKFAEEEENFEMMIRLNQFKQNHILYDVAPEKNIKEITELIHQQTIIHEQFKNINIYNLLRTRFVSLIREHHVLRSDLQKKRFDELFHSNSYFTDISYADSIKSKQLYYDMNGQYYSCLGHFEKGADCFLSAIDLIDSEKHDYKNSFSHGYYYGGTILDLTSNYLSMKDEKNFLKWLNIWIDHSKKMYGKFGRNPHFEIEANILKLFFYRLASNLTKMALVLSEITEMLKKIREEQIQQPLLAIYYGECMQYYFFLKDYKSALNYLNKLLNNSHLKFEKNRTNSVKIFEIILQYELENYSTVSSLMEAAKKYFMRNNCLYKTEEIALYHMNQLLKADDKKSKAALCVDFKEKIDKAYENMFESNFEYYFSLSFWLKQKTTTP